MLFKHKMKQLKQLQEHTTNCQTNYNQ